MLRLFLASCLLVCTHQMSLCDYYEQIGVHRPECGHAVLRPAQDSVLVVTAPPAPRFSSLPACRNYFHSCMTSSMCESGTICSNGAGPGSCCTDPSRSRCPSATALNINCRKTRGVNWCHNDSHCHGSSTMASMCCPTGCNYNMCVHIGYNQPTTNFVSRSLVFSSRAALSAASSTATCPDPYMMDVRCIATKTTSWCIRHDDCPQNSLHPRLCCPTLCGYNTCVVKYAGKWQIA